MKSIGDLRPAPTIRDIPFDAPIAESRVILLGSNSFVRPIGDPERDRGFLSLEPDRERDKVPRSACCKDLPPRGIDPEETTLVNGVSVGLFGSLSVTETISEVADEAGCCVGVWAEDDTPGVELSTERSARDCERDIERGDADPEPCGNSSVEIDCWGFALKALKISTGKSATPMVRLAIVPRSADAPPEIGSHGPSSVSYSRGR